MPTITNNDPLGKAYGGSIASLNYNIQVGSQANSATITVFSENGSYEEPVLGEAFNLPPFNTEMIVVETQTNDDANTKVLQVEMVDSTVEILDKNLILIRGIHSTGLKQDSLNKDIYHFFNFGTLPAEARSGKAVENELFGEASIDKSPKKVSEGVWLLGRLRATFSPKSESIWNNGSSKWNQFEEPIWVKWESGTIRRDLSRWKNNEEVPNDVNGMVSEEGPPNVQYGYTLSDLKLLVSKLGMSIDDKGVMNDDNLLFNNSGTIRDCLSNALSKIGRTFYIDPFSKKIVVISNGDISNINANLNEKLSSIDQIEAAEQVSFTKSLKGISAPHLTIKGTLQFQDTKEGDPGSGNSPRYQRAIFKRINTSSLIKDLDNKEFLLLKKCMYLLSKNINTGAIDKYLYSLAERYNPLLWSGETDFSKDKGFGGTSSTGETDLNKPIFEAINGDGEWEDLLESELETKYSLNGYNTEKTIGALPLIRTAVAEDGTVDTTKANSPSSSYYGFVKNIMSIWSGIYISSGTTETRIKKRNYLDQSIDGSNFSFITYSSDTLVSEIQELQFLFEAILRAGGDENLSVANLAEIAGATTIANGWHTIAIKNNFTAQVKDIYKIGDIEKALNRNMFSFESTDSLYMLLSDEAKDLSRNLEKLCEDAFEAQEGTSKLKQVIRYEKIREDEKSSDDEDNDGAGEEPQTFSLVNSPSTVNQFSSRSLLFIQGNFTEVELFKNEINEIAPQNQAPFITSTVNYFRPPTKDDLDITNGVNSISVSLSEGGVNTRVSYSTQRYAKIDQSIILEYLGNGFLPNFPSGAKANSQNVSRNAFELNK